jgi:hypothetical protein
MGIAEARGFDLGQQVECLADIAAVDPFSSCARTEKLARDLHHLADEASRSI